MSVPILVLLLAAATAAEPTSSAPALEPTVEAVRPAITPRARAAGEPMGALVVPPTRPPLGSEAPVSPAPLPTPIQPPHDWFLFPAVYYLPETGPGGAVAGGRDFRLDGSPRTSTALLVAAASVQGQGSVDASADVWLRNASLLSVRGRAVNYPDRFYGIGSDSHSSYEEYTRRFLEGSASAEAATFSGRLRMGPRLAVHAEEERKLVPGGRLETSGLDRIHGWSGLGVGGSVTWDTRDHPLWPEHGAFAQGYYVRYLDGVGKNDGFGKGAVDLRTFQSIGGGRVLALNAVLETTDGQTPFSYLSRLGNARFLRGYRDGRYRDAMVWASQLELRAPIRGRFAMNAFAGAGNVFPHFSEFTLKDPKLAGGVGGRYRLTDGGANLRVDVAVGSSGPQFYVVLLEAF